MSPMFMSILFVVIGICLIVSGGIIVGSVKKLSGDDTAKKNTENVGIFMNILPGIAALVVAGYFFNLTRTGVASETSPMVILVLGVIFGLCLIISGGIVLGSVKKLSGDDTARKNIENVGIFMNILPGIAVLAFAVYSGFMMYNKNKNGSGQAYSPVSPSPL